MESNNVHNGNNQPQVGVVMVPFPAQGHINQLLHLSHIITSYGIPVHYAGSGAHNNQAKLRLNGWGSQNVTLLNFHNFSLPDYKSPPPPKTDPSMRFPAHTVEPLFRASTHLRQPVTDLLQELSTKYRRIVVIHDIAMTLVVQDFDSIPNAESYAFSPVSTFTMFTSAWESIPVKLFELESDYPSCIPTTEGTLSPEIADFIDIQCKSLGKESGRLYNTSRLIEGRYLELSEKLSGIKHYAIGPLNPGQAKTRKNLNIQKHTCLEWLNKQEKASVLYVAFGSTTLMTREQVQELAQGLESSRQKFIWVLRKADEDQDLAEGEQGLLQQLPEGFEERVKDRGIVVSGWAPQLDILAHPSTGGFLSHCEWNSCTESITMGVPIAAWPMHSEQPKNAFYVSEVLKIATVVRDWEQRDELVMASTIENAVKTLMASEEGAEMRRRASQLADAVGRSVSDGGASHVELDSFIAHITR